MTSALAAFMNGDIKFMASDFFHLVKKLPSGYFMEHVKTVTRFRTVYNYIAFSKTSVMRLSAKHKRPSKP
jgi:hypothetical protein